MSAKATIVYDALSIGGFFVRLYDELPFIAGIVLIVAVPALAIMAIAQTAMK